MYGGTVVALCGNPHDGKGAFEASLVFALDRIGFKERVVYLRDLIADIVPKHAWNNGDEYASRLIALFNKAMVDSACEGILMPVDGRPGEYQFEDVEFPEGVHPIHGRHVSIPPELMKLYASLPVQVEHRWGEPDKSAMLKTKGEIIRTLFYYCSGDPGYLWKVLEFLLNCSNNKQMLVEETNMWKSHLKDVLTYLQAGAIFAHAEKVANWDVHTAFREDLLRFLLVARLKKMGMRELVANVTQSALV